MVLHALTVKQCRILAILAITRSYSKTREIEQRIRSEDDLEARVEADFAEDVAHFETLVEIQRPHERWNSWVHTKSWK